MFICRRILVSVLYAGVVLAGLPLARAQEATTATLPEPLESVEATPLPVPKKQRSKPTLEISAKPQGQKPSQLPEQTPRPEEVATPAATVERKTHAKPRATPSARPEIAGSPVTGVMSLAAARAIAVKTRIPDYPYQAQRTNITGSGVCLMQVDTATGKVVSATMEQSTGNALLDKVTTDAFKKWRFKPGTASEVRVPITYE
jgi:TonB family protein